MVIHPNASPKFWKLKRLCRASRSSCSCQPFASSVGSSCLRWASLSFPGLVAVAMLRTQAGVVLRAAGIQAPRRRKCAACCLAAMLDGEGTGCAGKHTRGRLSMGVSGAHASGAPAEGASEPAERAAMLQTVSRPSRPAALCLWSACGTHACETHARTLLTKSCWQLVKSGSLNDMIMTSPASPGQVGAPPRLASSPAAGPHSLPRLPSHGGAGDIFKLAGCESVSERQCDVTPLTRAAFSFRSRSRRRH